MAVRPASLAQTAASGVAAPAADDLLHPAWPSASSADHLVVPWAVGLSDPCREALAQLDAAAALPHLRRLLQHMAESERLQGDEYDRAPPHERFLAHHAGWPSATNDPLPFAALWAAQEGLPVEPGQAWGLLTPTHWLMGRDHLTLLHPGELALDAATSRSLFEAVLPLFDGDGWRLHWAAPTRWYAVHESLADLPTASLDRVIGRNPDLWMADGPRGRAMRRLQSEVQMVLYQHPANDERQSQGQLPVNSFWLSGCGRRPQGAAGLPSPWPLALADGPRQALLRDDLPGWLAAWQALDEGPLKTLGQRLDEGHAVRLTLCGERHAVTLAAHRPRPGWRTAWERLRPWGRDTGPAPSAVLSTL